MDAVAELNRNTGCITASKPDDQRATFSGIAEARQTPYFDPIGHP